MFASAQFATSLSAAPRLRSVPPPVVVPATVTGRGGGRCACGGVCPACHGETTALSSHDFSGVRFHPAAPEITAPLRARAVTIGQDVYFHPGQFRPDSPEGESLIAHELAHTLQTRPEHSDGLRQNSGAGTLPVGLRGETYPSTISQPNDRLEQNATALAHGQTTHALAAPAGTALRSPFDNETADQRTRREQLLQAIQNAEANLIRLLQTGGLVDRDEVTATRGGTQGVVVPANTINTPQETFLSFARRDVLIRRVIRSLIAMATQYRTAPIGSDLPAAVPEPLNPGQYTTTITYPTGSSNYGGRNPAWSQLEAAYELYRRSQGQIGDEYELDWYYLSPSMTFTPGAARGARRTSSGIQTGAYMVVPDIEHEPLRYWRLTGYDPIPRGSVIVEFWHDDLGDHYLRRGERIDVPSPWSSDLPRR